MGKSDGTIICLDLLDNTRNETINNESFRGKSVEIVIVLDIEREQPSLSMSLNGQSAVIEE